MSLTSFKIRHIVPAFVYIMALISTLPSVAQADTITPFLGSYTGTADFDENGTSVPPGHERADCGNQRRFQYQLDVSHI